VTQVSLYFLYGLLRFAFFSYTTIAVLHFLIQVFYAQRTYRQSERTNSTMALPAVDVIVPSYNEDPAQLRACFDALVEQDYEGVIRVFVVDDGSPNRAELLPLYDEYASLDDWTVILPPENGGKRHAQGIALAECDGDITVTIDSDTQIGSDGIRSIVQPFEDPTIGAVTGDVGVSNERSNLLTRLIGMRYWVAFNQERAAQSYFRSVLCCSGPFSAYRRSVLQEVWPAYLEQTFKGTPCTYGDDRHLTNLVLSVGSNTIFLPSARALTNAPETLRGYLRQQLRWNKSFYREVLWTLPFVTRLGWYIGFEMAVQVLLPLLLTAMIATSAIVSMAAHPQMALRYLVVTAIMGVARCSYAIYRTRSPRFLLFSLYGFLHVGLLIPIRMRALFTLTDNRWGTRTEVPDQLTA
jgi:hyaluronan synthase/N-acetylglucosaminyltransferase